MPEYVGRRAELIAELFIQDLGAEKVVVSPSAADSGYDLLVEFKNSEGGFKPWGDRGESNGEAGSTDLSFDKERETFPELVCDNEGRQP